MNVHWSRPSWEIPWKIEI